MERVISAYRSPRSPIGESHFTGYPSVVSPQTDGSMEFQSTGYQRASLPYPCGTLLDQLMDLPHEFHSTFSGLWKYEFAGTVIFSRPITPEQVHDWRFFGHYSNAQSAKFSYDEKVSGDSGGNRNHRFFFARGGLGPAHPFLPRLLEQERLRPLFEKKSPV